MNAIDPRLAAAAAKWQSAGGEVLDAANVIAGERDAARKELRTTRETVESQTAALVDLRRQLAEARRELHEERARGRQ